MIEFSEHFRHADEVVVISRTVYGGLSPNIKAVLDRNIICLLPFFEVRDGYMRHKQRYRNSYTLNYYFYGKATDGEKATATLLNCADARNLRAESFNTYFFATAYEAAKAVIDSKNSTSLVNVKSLRDMFASERNISTTIKNETPLTSSTRIALIHGSPKKSKSVSDFLLDQLAARLPDCEILRCNSYDTEPPENCRAIVFSFPLYTNGLPSNLLRYLEATEQKIGVASPNALVCAISNNGFFEGEQNLSALAMIRHWARRSNLEWGQGIGVGAGPISEMVPVGRGPLKNLSVALDMLSANILAGKNAPPYTIDPNLPRFVYIAAAHISWRSQAKKNGVSARELSKLQV
jgi:multimeric flavodoxin WrbA